IKQRLTSNKKIRNYNYNSYIAYQECSGIDPEWNPQVNNNSNIICPLELQKMILNLVDQHYNRHMLLPKPNGEFIINSKLIWEKSVLEINQFCCDHNLFNLWLYLWSEWYSYNKWILWARAANNTISHIKTTMIVEYLCYILIRKVINQQLYRICLLQKGHYTVLWRKAFKKE
ncbi:13442_t:CDS:1, partial [Cetraspora pellucida]